MLFVFMMMCSLLSSNVYATEVSTQEAVVSSAVAAQEEEDFFDFFEEFKELDNLEPLEPVVVEPMHKRSMLSLTYYRLKYICQLYGSRVFLQLLDAQEWCTRKSKSFVKDYMHAITL